MTLCILYTNLGIHTRIKTSVQILGVCILTHLNDKLAKEKQHNIYPICTCDLCCPSTCRTHREASDGELIEVASTLQLPYQTKEVSIRGEELQ